MYAAPRYRPEVRHAPRVLALLFGSLACEPLPVDIPLVTPGDGRAQLVALARDGVFAQVAVIEAPDVDPRHLPALPAVDDAEIVQIVVVTLARPLEALGLTRGLYDASAPAGVPIAEHAEGATVVAATVEADRVSAFEPLTSVPSWLARVVLPSSVPCLDLRARPLPDLPNAATFVLSLTGDRALVGVRANATGRSLFAVGADGTVTAYGLERPPEVTEGRFYPTGALPIRGAPGEVLLSMFFGELWIVRIPDEASDVPIAPRRRITSELTSGLAFLTGESSTTTLDIYGFDRDGALAHFDGVNARTLYRFAAGSYAGGGVVVGVDGVVFASRPSENNVVRVVSDAVRVIPIDGAREGLPSLASVPGLGLVVGDGRGRLYTKTEDDTFTPLGELDLGTGAQAIVPIDGGFLAGGGAGTIREWRTGIGACPAGTPAVSQTLRFWTKLGDGFVVSGPERDGAQMFETPLTLFEHR